MELFLVAGTILMLAVMLYIRKNYEIALWKTVISSIILTVSGLAGTRVMYWLETGRWSGVSFFGAILFTPLVMMLAALLLRVRIGTMLDMCAPSECIMLALMKVRCLYFGCCEGRVMLITEGREIRFPSQITEMLMAIVLLAVLVCLIQKNRYKHQIYACYMIGYGVARFWLNLLRDTDPVFWILPIGNYWALLSVIIGIILMVFQRRHKSVET